MQPNISKKGYFFGFDYLRAAFCLCVVALHANLFGPVTKLGPNMVNGYLPTVSDIIYFNILLLAVPVFVQLSLFLYVIREGGFKARMSRLARLYIFWGCIAMLVSSSNIISYFSNIKEILITVMTTRSIYYFFFILILTTVLTEAYSRILSVVGKMRTFVLYAAFALSLAFFIYAPYKLAQSGVQIYFWNPVNYIPYVFSSFVLAEFMKGKGRVNIAGIFFVLYIILSVADWAFRRYYTWNDHLGSYVLPEYMRISLVFGSMFFVYAFTSIKSAPWKVAGFLSSYSLGIYCFHFYLRPPIEVLTTLGIPSGLAGISRFAISLLSAVLLTFLFKKSKLLKNFV